MNSRIFDVRPGMSLALLPDPPKYTVVAVSDDFLHATGLKRETALGKGYFEILPQTAGNAEFIRRVEASFNDIHQHKNRKLFQTCDWISVKKAHPENPGR